MARLTRHGQEDQGGLVHVLGDEEVLLGDAGPTAGVRAGHEAVGEGEGPGVGPDVPGVGDLVAEVEDVELEAVVEETGAEETGALVEVMPETCCEPISEVNAGEPNRV